MDAKQEPYIPRMGKDGDDVVITVDIGWGVTQYQGRILRIEPAPKDEQEFPRVAAWSL